MVRKNKVLFLLFVVLLILVTGNELFARPAGTDLHTLSQPDGTTFKARQWGDEDSNGWETEEGYTIVFDDAIDRWTYAVRGTDGNLVSSGFIVGRDSPPDVSKGLRPTRDTTRKKLRSGAIQHMGILSSLAGSEEEWEIPTDKPGVTPVILITFPLAPVTYTPADFTDLLFGTGNYTLKDYFEEVSYGKFTVSGQVEGWYMADNAQSYYGNSKGKRSAAMLAKEAVRKADLTIDFGLYDQNEDCYADVVSIIHQGKDSARSGNPDDIWSHQWDFYSSGIGEYITNDVCSKGGNIKVNTYVILSEIEVSDGQMATVGTFAHEYSHALGLPDLYDLDGTSFGIGRWSLMAGGGDNMSPDGRKGDRPAHLDAWSKFFLGWVTPTQVTGTRISEPIEQSAYNADVYQFRAGTPLTGEYFLVENRQKVGFDEGLPGDGLLIWHIDTNSIVRNYSANTVNNNECKPSGPSPTMGRACAIKHYGVRLVQADAGWHMEKKINDGDFADPFPGWTDTTSFTPTSTPSSNLYNGTPCGPSITNISASGATMTADLSLSRTACTVVSGGEGHTTAINHDGGLWSWGWNHMGQIGNDTQVDRELPMPVMSGGQWISLAAGGWHTAAIKYDGTLWAWGYNASGQLGVGILGGGIIGPELCSGWWDCSKYPYLVSIPDTDPPRNPPARDDDWVSVSAGAWFTTAIKSDGTLWAWGANNLGQLGIGNTTNQYSPVQVGSGTNWVSVSAGSSFTTAIKSDGTLWAWGGNYYGELGVGNTTNQYSPVRVGTDKDWVAVSAGGSHTMAIKSNGTLWGWGSNYYGQLGISASGPNTCGVFDCSVNPVLLGGNWVSVSAGEQHTTAIDSNGALWAWGINWQGELATGSNIGPSSCGSENAPCSRTKIQIGNDSDWVSVFAGHDHNIAQKSNGTLWAWGRNFEYELGVGGINEDRYAPVQISKYWAPYVKKDGRGDDYGTVTSNPDGALTSNFDKSVINTVTLTASVLASEVATFAGWSGECSGTGTCTLSAYGLDTVKEVTATFDMIRYALTVSKTGTGSGLVTSNHPGIDCGSHCTELFYYDLLVSLTASASAGSTFTGWGGACSGTGSCKVATQTARSVTANFTLNTYDLTVSKTGTGSGTVASAPAGIDCGADCSETYNYNTPVILTASASAGSTFTGWSGACTGMSICSVTMDNSQSVTANFTLNTYRLTVSKTGTGSGTVTSVPAGIDCGTDCSETYNYNTPVILTASASAGSAFTGWSGACTGTSTCSVTMNAAKSVIATFNLPYTLTVSKTGTGSGKITSSPAGINCGSDCLEAYNYNTPVILTASASTGSTFTGWSGTCTGTGTCSVTMDNSQSVTANFTLNTYDLTVSKTGTGSGTVASLPAGIDCGADCSETYNYNTPVILTASASAGSAFTGWSGACTGTGSCTVTMKAAKSVIATFNLPYTLTVSKTGTGSGTVTSVPAGIDCGADCLEVYYYNAVVTLSAAPDAGFIFTGWSGACTGTGTCTVTMNAAKSVIATFNLPYTLTVSKTGTGSGKITSSPAGINCGANCSETYSYNTPVILKASASAGSTFTGWSGACTGIGPCTVTMDAAKSVIATFNLPYTLTVSRAGTGSGSVTSVPAGIDCGSDCSEAYNYNADVTLSAAPDAGSTFTGWSGACTGTGECTVTMYALKYVTANFIRAQYTLPDTGQTTCYQGVNPYAEIPCNGTTGQDGDYNSSPMSFTDNGNGTVTDNNTGLIWQKCSAGQNNDSDCSGSAAAYNWYEASGTYHATYNSTSENICSPLNLGNRSDWRLPTQKELMSIVDYSVLYSANPMINSFFFPNTGWDTYWSSATDAYDPGYAWFVHFQYGYVGDYDKVNYGFVRCVRGGQLEFGNFIDNQDGTVTDNSTALMWQQAESDYMTWEAALDYCNGLDLANKTDWRLPNFKELESLTDDTRNSPAIDTLFFPNAYTEIYWSSTTNAYFPDFAWTVYYGKGETSYGYKSNSFNVRCVRDNVINPPSELSTKATSSSTIVLTWKDNARDEKGFKVERKAGFCSSTSPWAEIISVGANVITYTDTNRIANRTYAYRVKAYNETVTSDYSDCVSVRTAISGTPEAPTNLKATAITAGKITLTWTDNATDEEQIEIWRKAGAGAWVLLITLPADATTYSDTTATGNSTIKTYSYYLNACNANGCSPTTSTAVVPYRPVNLTATALTGKIDLAWTDKSTIETGNQVYRKDAACSGAGTFTLRATKGANATTHSDTGLTSGTMNAYKVRTYKKSTSAPYAYGYSLWSNCDDAVVP